VNSIAQEQFSGSHARLLRGNLVEAGLRTSFVQGVCTAGRRESLASYSFSMMCRLRELPGFAAGLVRNSRLRRRFQLLVGSSVMDLASEER